MTTPTRPDLLPLRGERMIDTVSRLRPEVDAATAALRAEGKEVHPFQAGGLGIAPFVYTGHTEELFTIPGVPSATKPGGACALCYTAITNCYHFRDRDGRTFYVGSECAQKTVKSAKVLDLIKRTENKIRKEKTTARAGDAIERATAALASPEVVAALQAMPHPSSPTDAATERRNCYTWIVWCLANAGQTGKVKAARVVLKAAADALDGTGA